MSVQVTLTRAEKLFMQGLTWGVRSLAVFGVGFLVWGLAADSAFAMAIGAALVTLWAVGLIWGGWVLVSMLLQVMDRAKESEKSDKEST